MSRVLLAVVVLPAVLLTGSGCTTPGLIAHGRNGDLHAIEAALAKGPPRYMRTAAAVAAAKAGQVEALRRLLKSGADVVLAGDESGNTVMTAGALSGSVEVIKLAKSFGALPEARDKYGNTPLILAADNRRLNAVEALLAMGAEPNARNASNDAAIHWAVFRGDVAIVSALLKAGADPESPGAVGQSPLTMAQNNNHHSVAAVLRQAIDRRIAVLTGSPSAVPSAAPAAPVPVAPPALAGPPPVIAPSYRVAERGQDFAVVVGVEKYAELPEARFAERDAEAVREHLIALGYPPRNVVVLTGAKATKTGLIKNLETWLPNNVAPESSVFFFYSGHGAPEPRSGNAFLLPSDGDPQYLQDTGYPVKRLYEKLGELKSKRVIVALDSCFSGAGGRSVLAKGTRPLVTKSDIGAVKAGRVVALTASAGDQISGTDEDAGHGLFTAHLLRGLNGAAAKADGAVTLDSLYRYLSFKVADDARRANREQVPQLFPRDAAEVRLR